MSQYIDGFVLPVPRGKLEEYRQVAERAAALWKEHGALEYRECVGDDLQVEGMVPFPQLAGCRPEETVVFAWVVYASKEARDAANAKIMADPRVKELCDPAGQIFDCTRMAYGGFRSLVQA
ncbi:MAG: DUF1428 domain-containing protein [Verrucomicrobiales bacterium]|nr:DUF1428 domain-containing protein [Verrucomicrobiales bacterium]